MVFRLWGSARQQTNPGWDLIISITAIYCSPAHHGVFNCAKRMISCDSISQERSRKVAYALTTAKTSGNDGLLIVSWWWHKACGCVPWYSSDSGRMGKGFSIQVWTVCDNVTSPRERTPVASKGSEGTASDTFCRSVLTSGNAKLEVVLPVILTYRGKTREVALQTRRVTAPHVHAVGRVREQHWTTDIKGTVEVEAAEL